jgi:hypothetical protein
MNLFLLTLTAWFQLPIVPKIWIPTPTVDTDQRHNRSELEVNRQAAGKVLVDLKIEKARIEGDRLSVEADLGPVKYLSTLLGTDSESALRVFILVVAMLLDPLAVLLPLAATHD